MDRDETWEFAARRGEPYVVNGLRVSKEDAYQQGAFIGRFSLNDAEKPLAELLVSLDIKRNEPAARIKAVIGLARKEHLPADAILEVARHLLDDGEVDIGGGNPVFGTWVPKVSFACKMFLPRIVVRSGQGLQQLINTFWALTEQDQARVRDMLLAVGQDGVDIALASDGAHRQDFNPLLDAIFFDSWAGEHSDQCLRLSQRNAEWLKEPIGYLIKGDPRRAAKLLNQATLDHPEDLILRGLEATALQKAGALQQAVDMWQQLHDAADQSPPLSRLSLKHLNELRQALSNIEEAAHQGSLFTKDAAQLQASLESNPSIVLGAALSESSPPRKLIAALGNVAPERLKSWCELFPEATNDPRWHLVSDVCRDSLQQALRRATIASLVAMAVLIGSGFSGMYRLGMKGKTWLVNPLVLLFVIVAMVASGSYWSQVGRWSRLFAVTRTESLRTRWEAWARGGLWLHSTGMVLGAAFIVLCAAYFPASSATGTITFSRWGLTFEQPANWLELEREEEDTEGKLPSKIEHFAILDVGNGVTATATIEHRESAETSESAFQARKRELSDAQATGDVTRINSVTLTQMAGHPAITTDVERRNAGRAVDVHILYPSEWIGIALLSESGQVEPYQKDFEHLVKSVSFTP